MHRARQIQLATIAARLLTPFMKAHLQSPFASRPTSRVDPQEQSWLLRALQRFSLLGWDFKPCEIQGLDLGALCLATRSFMVSLVLNCKLLRLAAIPLAASCAARDLSI